MSPNGHAYADLIKAVNDREGGHATDEQIIDAIYAKRFKLDANGNPVNFKSSPKLARGLKNRPVEEVRAAHEMLQQEQKGVRYDLDFSNNASD